MGYVLAVGGLLLAIAALWGLGEWLGGDSGPSWGYKASLVIGFIVSILALMLTAALQDSV